MNERGTRDSYMRTAVTIINSEVVRAIRGLVVLPEEGRVHGDGVFHVSSPPTYRCYAELRILILHLEIRLKTRLRMLLVGASMFRLQTTALYFRSAVFKGVGALPRAGLGVRISRLQLPPLLPVLGL